MGLFWFKLGYFLFKHLITLFVNHIGCDFIPFYIGLPLSPCKAISRRSLLQILRRRDSNCKPLQPDPTPLPTEPQRILPSIVCSIENNHYYDVIVVYLALPNLPSMCFAFTYSDWCAPQMLSKSDLIQKYIIRIPYLKMCSSKFSTPCFSFFCLSSFVLSVSPFNFNRLLGSVTRWLDYFSIVGHLQH